MQPVQLVFSRPAPIMFSSKHSICVPISMLDLIEVWSGAWLVRCYGDAGENKRATNKKKRKKSVAQIFSIHLSPLSKI